MVSDLKMDIDGIRLNVRVGAILRHGNKVVIEISKLGKNSVIPGGRIKIGEKSSLALIREIEEEMGFKLKEESLTLIKTLENFFNFEGQNVHEIYFLYEYSLSKKEIEKINKLEINKDNSTTYFKFVNKNDISNYNLLPLEIYGDIKK